MLEVTKALTTSGDVEVKFRLTKEEAAKIAIERIAKEIRKALDEALTYSPEEVLGPRQTGRLIRGGRAREGWTQVELAKRLNVSKTVISDLENGRREISKKMAAKLGEASAPIPRFFLPFSFCAQELCAKSSYHDFR